MDYPRPSTPLSIRTKQKAILSACASSLPLPPLLPFSSRDSGYGSESTTPEKPSTPCITTLEIGPYAFDGNSPEALELPPGTESDAEYGHGQHERLAKHGEKDNKFDNSNCFRTPKKQKTTSVNTPHKPSSKSASPFCSARSALPVSFFSTPTRTPVRRRGSDSISSFLSSGSPLPSLRSPDRFVHPRNSSETTFPLAEKFHLTRSPEELSPVERLLRHSGATDDVFCSSPPRFNPMPTGSDIRRASLQEAGFPPLTRTRTTLEPVDDDSDLDPATVNSGQLRTTTGSVWSAGTIPPVAGAINDGSGNLVQTGTNAPYFLSNFVFGPREHADDENKHTGRLAAALNFDRASRLLQCSVDEDIFASRSDNVAQPWKKRTRWDGAGWVKDGVKPDASRTNKEEPLLRPLRILSAPNLRDDFYCSLLAYSPTCDTVAVGLGDLLYRWSEKEGAKLLNGSNTSDTWLTALAFSSTEGGKNILAFGRANGSFGLSSMQEPDIARILVQERAPISCISWRPTVTMRPSKNPNNSNVLVPTEDLLVGDDGGTVLYYIVEWPEHRGAWQGDITVVARLTVHSQQICGLSWSADGTSFATGGNDNICCLFNTDDVLPRLFRPGGTGKSSLSQPQGPLRAGSAMSTLKALLPGIGGRVHERLSNDTFVRRIYSGMESWRWEHGAAVKAIAFCPWQKGLVATGGGSNDKCIHFFHTTSGAALATIFVSAQVTSLIWSTTRREIAVTFGFTHPTHSIRIAVYAWPSCKQVAAIPWEGKHRALFGISCSRGPHNQNQPPPLEMNAKRGDGQDRQSRTLKEGCIAIASSDESIKFYELWPSDERLVTGGVGMLGGSDILEDLEGIQKEGDIIR